MQLKVIWVVTLTLYNIIVSCKGGALPYIQGQHSQPLINRSPARIYGAPISQPPLQQQVIAQPQLQVQRPLQQQQYQQVPQQRLAPLAYTSQIAPQSLSSIPALQRPQIHQTQQYATVTQPKQYQPVAQPIARQDTQASAQKVYTSYAPLPSGKEQVHIGTPTLAPLPPLQPDSVYHQIMNADNGIAKNHIVVENYSTQDSTSFLSSANNSTLYAANLLAKSLLEASQEGDIPLNKTDLVVVKTQKKAYIIPMSLQGQQLNQSQAQELYKSREKLPVAYTVNQFLFIIKPENVNFLNKLV